VTDRSDAPQAAGTDCARDPSKAPLAPAGLFSCARRHFDEIYSRWIRTKKAQAEIIETIRATVGL